MRPPATDGWRHLVICHEVAHAIIPEHQLVLLHQGPEVQLGWRMRRLLRGQANRFAATLLFGGVPDAIIPASEICLDAVRVLAALADASLEVAFRRFVSRHPGRVWGLACGPGSEVQGGDAGAAGPAVTVRYAMASTPAIWCGMPRTVARSAARTAVLVEGACPAGLERFLRVGARTAEWTEEEQRILVLLR